MLQFEVASTSPLALHHDHEDLPEWHGASTMEDIGHKTQQALISVKELIVEAELSIEEIAEYFGIHHFGIHIMKKSLSECRIILTSDSYLEIERKGTPQRTRFKVAKKQPILN